MTDGAADQSLLEQLLRRAMMKVREGYPMTKKGASRGEIRERRDNNLEGYEVTEDGKIGAIYAAN